MIIFGIAEIIFSQIPDFDQIWWLSIVAAVMSFTYSTIGLGLGIAKVVGMLLSYHYCPVRKFYINYYLSLLSCCFKRATMALGANS